LKKNNQYYFLVVIIILTIIVFSPTFENGFTNWDDHLQVTENPQIKELSIQNIKTIFSSFYVGMYQPLTTLSFTLEYSFFGLNATGFHTVSLFFHLLNILLVFWLIKLLTIRKDIAILTTALFAVHPMFVEVIAWVSARSTLMYASFYLAAIISYLYYLKELKINYFFIALVLFLLSLLTKAMAITLPILLILFDFYYGRKILSKKVIIEKISFLILSLLFGLIAIKGRQIANHFTVGFTFLDKILIMIYQIYWYILKFFIPTELSAFYPNPKKVNGFLPVIYYLSPFFIILFGVVSFRCKKYWKKILFCFFFFLIPISIVLKIVQVGNQVTTDRYTYISFVGILLLLSFIYQIVTDKRPKTKPYLIILICVIFTSFSFLSYQQTKIWHSSVSLWTNVIDKNKNIALAHLNIGAALVDKNNLNAEKHFLKSMELDSTFAIPYNNLGYIYLKKNPKKAEEYLFKAMKINSSYLYIYTNLASLYMKTDKEKARKYIDIAISLNSKNKYVLERINSWNKQWGNK
jgi:hypothetical protein